MNTNLPQFTALEHPFSADSPQGDGLGDDYEWIRLKTCELVSLIDAICPGRGSGRGYRDIAIGHARSILAAVSLSLKEKD